MRDKRAQTMYTHVSKCKNDKIKERKKIADLKETFKEESKFSSEALA
jgi:hypothetical protein